MENALVVIDQPGPPAQLEATRGLAADFARASEARTTLAAGVRERLACIRGLVQERGSGASRLAGRGLRLSGR